MGIKMKKYEINQESIKKIRRCTVCILPETMPFITFDQDGVCNYCKSYKKMQYIGKESLINWAEQQKRCARKHKYDSVVAFSGGRDSSYGLHYFVKELGMKPVAFNYDWGMATDQAIRNQQIMCRTLGVKLVQKEANIQRKRENIRKNILAWMKKPDMGMVPLFMAGDKQYFYYANKLQKQMELNCLLLASNPLEKTHFKTGYCGIKPGVLREKKDLDVEQLFFSDVAKMTGYYLKQFFGNPAYINASLVDTAGATISDFFIPHRYFRLFNYIPWDETEVNRVLIEEYGWETASDSNSTWRIGDGTAAFYNYVYYYVGGFTENDTLRSNQIREGMLGREKALELVYLDNQPRFDAMKWYFDIIHLDMELVLNAVRSMRTLY